MSDDTTNERAGALTQADLAGLVLHGVNQPMALATVVRRLNDAEVRSALYEVLVMFATAAKHADVVPPRAYLDHLVASAGLGLEP